MRQIIFFVVAAIAVSIATSQLVIPLGQNYEDIDNNLEAPAQETRVQPANVEDEEANTNENQTGGNKPNTDRDYIKEPKYVKKNISLILQQKQQKALQIFQKWITIMSRGVEGITNKTLYHVV